MSPCRPLYSFVYEKAQICKRGLHAGKFTLFFQPSQTGTFCAVPKLAQGGTLVAVDGCGAKVNRETGVGRYRKIGGSLEESARSAQRGLLVILASALIWIAAIWIGYRFFS